MFTPRRTGRQMRKRKKIGHLGSTESMRTRNLRYNSTQSPQTAVWPVQIRRRWAAVAATCFMAMTSEERPRLDANVKDNPRSRRTASVGQFANSQCAR